MQDTNKKMPTTAQVAELLLYSQRDGSFTWKARTSGSRADALFNGKYAGKLAGNQRRDYAYVTIAGSTILVHHLVWFIEKGYWSDCILDHIDGNPSNNRISNLREVTNSQNQMNKVLSKSNKSGTKGVFFNNKNQKWQATIGLNRKSHHLGCFDTIEEARAARMKAEAAMHGEFSLRSSRA